MRFQLASAFLAACVAAAKGDTTRENLPKSRNQDIFKLENDNTHPTSLTTQLPGTKRRLLQERKQRVIRRHANHPAEHSSDASADIGILFRSLEKKKKEDNKAETIDYYCPRDTCPKSLCDCADAGGDIADCYDELRSVCYHDQLDDCVFEGYVALYRDVYCPFASCLGDGFELDKCDCQFYNLYCSKFASINVAACQKGEKGSADGIFGCDDLKDVCETATLCRKRGELEGLPELDTLSRGVGIISASHVAQQNSANRRIAAYDSVTSTMIGLMGLTLSVLWSLFNH